MEDDRLVGIAGFHAPEGSLAGGIVYKDLVSLLGFIEGSWPTLILSLYERKPETEKMLMGGIASRLQRKRDWRSMRGKTGTRKYVWM